MVNIAFPERGNKFSPAPRTRPAKEKGSWHACSQDMQEPEHLYCACPIASWHPGHSLQPAPQPWCNWRWKQRNVCHSMLRLSWGRSALYDQRWESPEERKGARGCSSPCQVKNMYVDISRFDPILSSEQPQPVGIRMRCISSRSLSLVTQI